MCGIAGIASDDRGGLDLEALAAMSAALRHRGPDDAGEARLDGCLLAARRLAIIDLEAGHQPIAGCGDRVTVVQNGEILNHAALHDELVARGHAFRTRCDTEVLAHGYEEWGDELLGRLRGMFALAIWDAGDGRLLLARDRFGIKPLFYAAHGGRIAFASELTALAHAPGFSRELDPDAVEAYLAFNSIPAPLTAYRAARKLPPGHRLDWRGGRPPPGGPARPPPPGGPPGGPLAARRAPLRHRPPRARSAPGRRRAAARHRGRLRRAVRGLVGAADLPRLPARRRPREGGALRRGRRRALRWLPDVRR